jgi:2-polyprenyl-3-methyl-5-hydroxy-6-metoxy-1,4-benzoquinol methylase
MVNTSSPPVESATNPNHHVCPWWVGYLLASPVRGIFENPGKLLSPWVRPGMTVLDIGCAMGYFSLPLARAVGPGGRVLCLDVQERMLRSLEKRARRKGLSKIIDTRRCSQESLNIDDVCGRVDVVLVFHVVHESLYPGRFLEQCFSVLRKGGRLILAEPMGHLSAKDRDRTFDLAAAAGFVKLQDLSVRKSRAAVFEKPAAR